MIKRKRKYDSLEAALEYCKSKGIMGFAGKVTQDVYIYSLDIPGRPRYILYIHQNGLIELVSETSFRG